MPTIIPGTVVAGPGLETPIYDGAAGLGAINRFGGADPWWFGGEYLAWWSKSANLPLLITTSSPQFNGIPGLGDTTSVLSGNFGDTFHSGARFTLGRWFGPCQTRGFEGRFFFLNETDSTFTASSTSSRFSAAVLQREQSGRAVLGGGGGPGAGVGAVGGPPEFCGAPKRTTGGTCAATRVPAWTQSSATATSA